MSGSDHSSHHQNQSYAYQALLTSQQSATDQALQVAPMASTTPQYILMQQQPAQPYAVYNPVNQNYYYVQNQMPQAFVQYPRPQQILGQQLQTNAYSQPAIAADGQYYFLPQQYIDPNLAAQYQIRPYAEQAVMLGQAPQFMVPSLAQVPQRPQMSRPQFQQAQQQAAYVQQGVPQGYMQQNAVQNQAPVQAQHQQMPQAVVASTPQGNIQQPVAVPPSSSHQTPLQAVPTNSIQAPQVTQQTPVQPIQPAPVTRQRKVIKIEDPNTGKEVELPPAQTHKPAPEPIPAPVPPVATLAAVPDETERKSPGAIQSQTVLQSNAAQASKPKSNVALEFATAVSKAAVAEDQPMSYAGKTAKGAAVKPETKPQAVPSPTKPVATVPSPAKPEAPKPTVEEVKPAVVPDSQPAKTKTSAASFFEQAAAPVVKSAPAPAPTPAAAKPAATVSSEATPAVTASTIPPPSTLKPSKSDEGTPGQLKYARQHFLDIRSAMVQVPSIKVPDAVRKSAAANYSSDPFEAAGQWEKPRGGPRGGQQHQREPQMAPVKRIIQRTAEEDICREVRGCLNKMTPENFDSMTHRMHLLLTEQDERMKKVQDKARLFNDVVGIIFDKAISEPNLVETYAKMCTFLNKIEVSDKDGKKLMFKKVMLTYCQREFEDHDHGTARQVELEEALANAKTAEEKKLAGEDLEEFKLVLKRKYLGNIRLISELYRTKELTLTIMIDCINRLLKEQDEETLECLCKLLRNIGKHFEEQVIKGGKKDQIEWWKHVVHVLDEIVASRKTSSRIRFFIQDVIEARNDGWNFKQREAEGPKKIAEIRNDVEREHAEKERETAKYRGTLSGQRGGRGGGGRGGQGNIPHNASTGQLRQADGRGHESPSDIRSFGPVSIPTTSTDSASSTVLKPKWSVGSGWSKGAQTAQAQASASDEKAGASLAPGGRSGTGMSPAVMNSSAAGGYRGARSLEKQQPSQAGAGKPQRPDFSQSMSRSTTGPLTATRGQQPRASDAGLSSPVTIAEQMTDEVLTNSGSSLIAQYIRHKNIEDFLADAIGALAQPNASVFVKSAITSGLEADEHSSPIIGNLFGTLMRTGRINRQALIDGVVSVVDEGDDIEVDMPHFWAVLSKLIYHLVFGGGDAATPLSVDPSMFSTICANTKAENVDRLSENFLKVVADEQSPQQAGSFYRAAELKNCVSGDFIKKPQLSWLAKHICDDDEAPEPFSTPSCHSPDHQTTQAPGNVQDAHWAQAIDKIFSSTFSAPTEDPNESQNNDAIDKISKNFVEQTRQSPRFIHELTKALCSTCLIGSDSKSRLSEKHLNTRLDVLKRFRIIENKKHCQGVLTGAHELVVSLNRPPGLLAQLFTIFSDNDIVSVEDFVQWKESKTNDGRAIDIKNLDPFFKSIEV